MEKDRNLRYQHASDARTDLQRLKRDTESGKLIADNSNFQKPRRYRRPLLYGSALVIVLLALGFGFRWLRNQQATSPKVLSERQLTHLPSENRLLDAAISPDGKHLAYVDTQGLHLSVIETGEIHDVPLPEDLRTHLWRASWFPDGEKLMLVAQTQSSGFSLWLASVFGGAPRKLRSEDTYALASISPQGSSIAFVSGQGHDIWLMGANGESPHKILATDTQLNDIAWSPTGQRLAYQEAAPNGSGGSIETVSLNGETPKLVTSDPLLVSSMVWLRDGRLIFALANDSGAFNLTNLWEIMTDPQTGKTSGKPAKITNWDGQAAQQPSVSQDASRLVVLKVHRRDDVYVGELKDGGTRMEAPTRLTVSESENYPSAWTRDSQSVLFDSNRTGRNQVFKQGLKQETAEPLMQGLDDETGAEVSPDGAWILYWSQAHDGSATPATQRLMRIPAAGGSAEQILEVRAEASVDFDCPSPAAGSCVMSLWEQGYVVFHALDPVQGQGKELARTKLESPSDLVFSVSPDGSRIAISSQDQLIQQIRILELRGGTERNLPFPGWFIWGLRWASDGNAVFASVSTTANTIVRVDVDGKTRALFNQDRNRWLSFPRPSPDGRHLAFTQRTFESNAWLLENF